MDMMMEVLVLLFLLVISQLFLSLSFPLALGGVILGFGVLMAFLMVFSGSPLFGFCFYMVLVGGILVVFGYTVSLIPLVRFEENVGMVKSLGLSLLLFFVSFVWLGTGEAYSWSFFNGLEVLFFSKEWGVAIILLSILLLVAMITVVAVSGKHQGALIK